MARVRNRNTAPELHVQQALATCGLRFTTHNTNIPGRPDLVFNAYKAVLFIHGCFWHKHDCKLGMLPDANNHFWQVKLKANADRDKQVMQLLHEAGWRVRILWLCQLKNKTTFRSQFDVDALVEWIRGSR